VKFTTSGLFVALLGMVKMAVRVPDVPDCGKKRKV
jgi:hypothetical protein